MRPGKIQISRTFVQSNQIFPGLILDSQGCQVTEKDGSDCANGQVSFSLGLAHMHSAVSDLGLLCFLSPVCLNTSGKYDSMCM